jgi:hypothetical protein
VSPGGITIQHADQLVRSAATSAATTGWVPGAVRARAHERRLRERFGGVLAREAGVVETDHPIEIEEVGVATVDLAIRARPEHEPWALVDCKWSLDERDRIHESVGLAIKLALAVRYNSARLGWIVVVARRSAWELSPAQALFRDREVETTVLWTRPLHPLGPNGGSNIGSDCNLGPQSVTFGRVPERLVPRPVGIARLGDEWELRAARITPAGGLVTLPT